MALKNLCYLVFMGKNIGFRGFTRVPDDSMLKVMLPTFRAKYKIPKTSGIIINHLKVE